MDLKTIFKRKNTYHSKYNTVIYSSSLNRNISVDICYSDIHRLKSKKLYLIIFHKNCCLTEEGIHLYLKILNKIYISYYIFSYKNNENNMPGSFIIEISFLSINPPNKTAKLLAVTLIRYMFEVHLDKALRYAFKYYLKRNSIDDFSKAFYNSHSIYSSMHSAHTLYSPYSTRRIKSKNVVLDIKNPYTEATSVQSSHKFIKNKKQKL